MQKNRYNFSIFFVFLLLSVFVLGLWRLGILNSISSFFAGAFSPIQSAVYKTYKGVTRLNENSELQNLKDENLSLKKQLITQKKYQDQNRSLLDQFQTISPKSSTLIPAEIIGAPSFIPGVSVPETFILNKGEKDGVKIGNAVVVKDNLIGRVVFTSSVISKVDLLTNSGSSFTGKNPEKVLGVVKGLGNGEMIFDNALLSENLKDGDLILTNGDIAEKGVGYPPDLIVGKIISIDKIPSALFQRANLKSLIDFNRLSTVFILSN